VSSKTGVVVISVGKRAGWVRDISITFELTLRIPSAFTAESQLCQALNVNTSWYRRIPKALAPGGAFGVNIVALFEPGTFRNRLAAVF
jgi:hypothetical protein